METRICIKKTIEFSLFKSYYVVWKLCPSMKYISGFFAFKSYYVVWKRKLYNDTPGNTSSLNRTM